MNWNVCSDRLMRGTAYPGSARGSRAVFGGSPKTIGMRGDEKDVQTTVPFTWTRPFDEPSNGARQRRALPNPQNSAG
jgi:hypothetical protein